MGAVLFVGAAGCQRYTDTLGGGEEFLINGRRVEETKQGWRREDGSLVSHDDVSGLLALPEELRERSATAAVRTIEGKKYLVFRY